MNERRLTISFLVLTLAAGFGHLAVLKGWPVLFGLATLGVTVSLLTIVILAFALSIDKLEKHKRGQG